MAQFTHEFKITGPQMSLTFSAPEGTTTIGRSAENDLVFVHPLVSRHHAHLESAPEACQVVDLGSTHGTMVNRQQLEAQTAVTLHAGDVIEIGAFRMEYQQIEVIVSTPVYEPPEPEEEPPLIEPAPEPEPQPAEEEAPVIVEGELVTDTAVAQPASPAPPKEETTRAYAPVPPLPPQPPVLHSQLPEGNGRYQLPPGLSATYSRYLEYLPEIYHGGPNSFITRFLALLESILSPIEWNIDNFDLYLDPKAAPASFLPWLANWYEMTFDESWSEASQRQLLAEAHTIYPRRGTVWALRRILEIYSGVTPDINDQGRSLEAFTFTVRFPLREQQINRTAIERIINANKPAHTNYSLIFQA